MYIKKGPNTPIETYLKLDTPLGNATRLIDTVMQEI